MDRKPPPGRKPKDLAGYLEALSRPVFQAGMSRRVIDAKWDGIRVAFAAFDPRKVADATIDKAQALLELDAEYGGFDRYLQSHDNFSEAVADLKRQFRFIGNSGAHHFLWVVGRPVAAAR